MREVLFIAVASLLSMPALFVGLDFVFAQAMQSSNYRIESDSINFGGGLSTSSNYTLESTAGEIATGESGSASYNLKAGYQQMHTAYISISGATAVTLSPTIPGVGGGTSNGSTTVTVITDSAAGYSLSIKASQSPAMQKGGDSILDYNTTGDPDYSFTTNATDSHFGYSPSGVNIVQRFKDDGVSACNTGSNDTALACWEGLTTSDVTIAQSTSSNHPLGATTTINFRVGIGGSVIQLAGTYIATTTLTALAL